MDVEKSSRSLAVSDVALAADRIRLVAGKRGVDDPVKVLWERAYRALAKQNDKWTRRRVRALWNREAARIEHREMVEMDAVLLCRTRRAHAEFKAETERLAAVYLIQEADRDDDKTKARGGSAGELALPRIGEPK